MLGVERVDPIATMAVFLVTAQSHDERADQEYPRTGIVWVRHRYPLRYGAEGSIG